VAYDCHRLFPTHPQLTPQLNPLPISTSSRLTPSLCGKKGEQDSISPLFVVSCSLSFLKGKGSGIGLRERLKILSEVEGGELKEEDWVS
jgi:hypothetical protein